MSNKTRFNRPSFSKSKNVHSSEERLPNFTGTRRLNELKTKMKENSRYPVFIELVIREDLHI